jgi:hypothetical protein
MKYLRTITRPIARTIIGAVAALFVAVSLGATEEQLSAANAAFARADGGDGKAAAEAVAKFGELVKAEPDNPFLLVHMGAATTMQARATVLPWKKMSLAENGMAMQDKAVAMLAPRDDTEVQDGAPVSLRVRYVAANTFLAVPEFFDRKQRGQKLLSEVLGSPLFSTTSVAFRGHVWMRAAKYAEKDKRMGDAKMYLNSVISSGAPQASQAQGELQRISR